MVPFFIQSFGYFWGGPGYFELCTCVRDHEYMPDGTIFWGEIMKEEVDSPYA